MGSKTSTVPCNFVMASTIAAGSSCVNVAAAASQKHLRRVGYHSLCAQLPTFKQSFASHKSAARSAFLQSKRSSSIRPSMTETVQAVAAPERLGLIAPHGGKLINLMLSEDKKQAAIDSCTKSIELSDRNACDVELLIVGYVFDFLKCILPICDSSNAPRPSHHVFPI